MTGGRELQHHDRQRVPEHVVDVTRDALPLVERGLIGDHGTGARQLVASEAEPVAELAEPPPERESHHPVLPAPVGATEGGDDGRHGDGCHPAHEHDPPARLGQREV